MRIESSIITSLSELRAIEQQRIAEERAARERERTQAIEAARVAELARVEAEQARLRAEREERMRLELARAEAEREARLRVEATEAAERARLAAQLEERRLAEELELRRAEVAKKRPTWMVAVTAIAAVAAIGLTWFALDRSRDMERSQQQQKLALAEKERAKEELRETLERLAALEADVSAFDDKLVDLQRKLTAAQTAADRKRLADEIAAADAAKRDAQRRLAAERAARERAERLGGVDVSKCVGTAVGCLEHK